MELLYDSPTTRISIIDKNTENVFITFNGLTGHGIRDHAEITLEEFKSLSKNYTTIFIADKTMSWGNHVDWEEAAKIINPLIKRKNATSVGLSMGGSNAILSTIFFNVKRVVAFNPQYTVYPVFHPETEYIDWSKNIKTWRFYTVYEGFRKDVEYLLCWSTQVVSDTYFLKLFPKYIVNINFGDKYGHNIAGDLKKDGRLEEFFNTLITQNVQALIEFAENTV